MTSRSSEGNLAGSDTKRPADESSPPALDLPESERPEGSPVRASEAQESVETPPACEQNEVVEPDDIAALRQIVLEVQQQLQELGETISTRLLHDEAKDRMFKTLHQELQEHRDGVRRQANKRLLRALLVHHDHMRSSLDTCANEDVRRELQFFLDELLGVFYAEEVEPIAVSVGDPFVPGEHRAVGTCDAGDASEDRSIGRVLRTGFRWMDSTLRPAEVMVRRYQAGECAGRAEGKQARETSPDSHDMRTEAGVREDA